MCRPATRPPAAAARGLAGIALLGVVLGGCSDIYYDRRDTIALSGGDAVAANAVEQMVDPWPPFSNDPNLAFDGRRMQSAVERYRNNTVTPPVDPTMMQGTYLTPATPQTQNAQASSSAQNCSSTASASSSGGQ